MPGLSENWIDGSLGGSNQQILHLYFLIYLTWFAFRLNPRSGEFKSLLCKISFSGLWLRYHDRYYFKQCFASLKIRKQTNINNQYLTTITSKSCVVRRTSFLYLRTRKAQVTCASAQSSNLVVFRLSHPVYFYILLYKNICCGYSFELPRQVKAIQTSTHNICFYKDYQKIITHKHHYIRSS